MLTIPCCKMIKVKDLKHITPQRLYIHTQQYNETNKSL